MLPQMRPSWAILSCHEEKGLLYLRSLFVWDRLFVLTSRDRLFRPDDALGPSELQNIEDALPLFRGDLAGAKS